MASPSSESESCLSKPRVRRRRLLGRAPGVEDDGVAVVVMMVLLALVVAVMDLRLVGSAPEPRRSFTPVVVLLLSTESRRRPP